MIFEKVRSTAFSAFAEIFAPMKVKTENHMLSQSHVIHARRAKY